MSDMEVIEKVLRWTLKVGIISSVSNKKSLNNFLVKTEVPSLNENDYQEDFEMDIEGWVFPAHAKFGKKGEGKKIKKKVVGLLKQFFLNRNINAKDKLIVQGMHLELKKFARSREINNDDIPQVSTIHN
ncbi:41751_t:CDS:2 [Gigaspora margarita]|uniref:41751_t:CDS:1 n=1 Tax=Gigaspora margarita TaxID=4874 RepID=A0ABN7W7E1_GIGMA|nr:41751_t:CDS:2 [Gigaspora margarita]